MEEFNQDPPVIAFRCLTCGEILDKGLCGDHREESDHLDFEPIYEISNKR
tara:strand:- start:2364 stop:2513 length:150 start_codon:yes stop_codon:yes gene_type:complete